MTERENGTGFPKGFHAATARAGLKREGDDLALFHSEVPATAAALFTRNHFPGAPVIVGRERVSSGRLQTIVVNAGISNVATGPAGIADAREMARLAGIETGVPEQLVLPASTGVIGRRLPMEQVRDGITGLGRRLGSDPWPAARAIMTTDRVAKVITASVGEAKLTAVGKGAGMIAPNLATMLVFLFTDAALDRTNADRILRGAAERSFQLLSVDTDTSTSDMVVLLANGLAGEVDPEAFSDALGRVCLEMAERIARDGEGATKLLAARVSGAFDDGEARKIARAIIESPLVKTMAYGADPNVGRILMAIGKCVDCRVEPSRVSAAIQGVEVIREGTRSDFSDAQVRRLLEGEEVRIQVELGVGGGEGLALGCDLTEGYIEENAAYAST